MTIVFYVHKPIVGLPASLLAREGDTLAVLALMQRQAGLNRLMRRDISCVSKDPRFDMALNGLTIEQSEREVLSIYILPLHRFSAFWTVVENRQNCSGKMGRKAYASAIDIQLIAAFESKWQSLSMDFEIIDSGINKAT
jgi:hypothetical protein